MKSYSETNVFSDSDKSRLAEATDFVSLIPDPGEGEPELRCHEVTRVVKRLMGYSFIHVVDGHIGAVQHSWLAYRDKGKLRILDVYCVGRLPQVMLLDVFGRRSQYEPDHFLRDDIDTDLVDRLVNEIRAALCLRPLRPAPR